MNLRQFQYLSIGTVLTWRDIIEIKISKNEALLVKDISGCKDEVGKITDYERDVYSDFLEVAPKQIQECFK